MQKLVRSNNRGFDELRKINLTYNVFAYSAGSVLFELGNTKVLCAVSFQQGVPNFLKGKKSGWLTAEYSLLPASTPVRTAREISINKRSGRSVEISRLIGRVLRSVIDFSALGENTLIVDCDVLQADGGTRTACITGSYLALKSASQHLLKNKIINKTFLRDELAAISVGVCGQAPILDLDFAEDSAAQADFNFVLTRAGNIVEIQGCAEASPINLDLYSQIQKLALKGVNDIFALFDANFHSEDAVSK